MTRAPSKHPISVCAFALAATLVAAPMACTLNLAGLPPGGAGGSPSTSTSTSSSSSSGTGGSTTCVAGSIVPCYDGPAETMDRGECKSGQRTCNAEGTGFDACIDQVLPALKDDCAASKDSDCSGVVDCGCTPGATTPCYDGPAGTENIGVCKTGNHTCNPDGTTFGACTMEIKPAPEDCFTTSIDEDCDGNTPLCTGTTQSGASLGSSPGDDILFGVATDPSGSLLFGGVAGAQPGSGAYFDVSSGFGIITKVGKNGAPSWTMGMAGGTYSAVRGVASDSKGNVFVVGEVRGATSGNTINVSSAGGVDIFVAKLDPGGTTVWAKSFGDGVDQFGSGITVDPSGNVIITGRTQGGVDFGGGAKSGGGGDDLFVVKLDSDGKHLWSRVLGDGEGQRGAGVAATPNGDVVVVGSERGTLDFGPGFSLTSGGQGDVFVARLAGLDGVTKWARRYGDSSDQGATAVAVGSNGSIVVTGAMVGKCDFGAGNLDATNGHANAFVVKLHPDGSLDWAHHYGSDGENQVGSGIAVDPAQNIALAGYFQGTLTFGGTVLTGTDTKGGPSTDIFVAKIAANGTSVWARQLGDSNDQGAWAVATDPAASVIAVGTYTGTVNLPPAIMPTGGYDAFWVELAP